MVFVTGDCHANFERFSADNFRKQEAMTRADTVLVCGDFGIWNDSPRERYWLDWLEQKQFTIAFVDGNHENFDRLYSDEFPVVDFHGAKAHQIRENLFHILRGGIFELEGASFFAFGGASSHDIEDGILDRENYLSDEHFMNEVKRWNKQGKMFRINHVSWWEQELPSQEEMDAGLAALSAHDNRVDYVITHCAPKEIAAMMGFYETDCLTDYFERLRTDILFRGWYFGHYHIRNRISMDILRSFRCLYSDFERIL